MEESKTTARLNELALNDAKELLHMLIRPRRIHWRMS
jgi:hypothetical protein